MGEGGVLSRSRAGVSNSWFLQHPHPCEGKVASCWEVDTNDTAPPKISAGSFQRQQAPKIPHSPPPLGRRTPAPVAVSAELLRDMLKDRSVEEVGVAGGLGV